ncbi:MAG: glycosyltransferase family 4 protein [Candidatus Promineifilaceae bacterium]
MEKKHLHQVIEIVLPGDAVSDHAFTMRDWLRGMGFESDIFVSSCGPGLEHEVKQFNPALFSSDEMVVYHHSIGSNVIDPLIERQVPLILMYQNITPPEFFETADPAMTGYLIRGREQLVAMRPLVRLALGASTYTQEELIATGYENTAVLPLVFHEAAYDVSNPDNLAKENGEDGPLLLFLGRVVPNKRQEDLVKLLLFLRRVSPDARLVLVGGLNEKNYVSWLRRFIDRNGLTDAVTLTGHTNLQQIAGYYRAADLFVSMSEHEGFCKPLIESMYFDLPVMAYASTAVPSTMGGSGVLFQRKDYEALAEMADIMIRDKALRERIIAGQKRRLQDFLEPNVREVWRSYLQSLDLL